MPAEFKVVRMTELAPFPGIMAVEPFEKEFAEVFTDALNRMAAEGWVFVSNYVFHNHVGPGYAIFRREAAA